ncbi:hypothetical protein [Luteolibacter sp. Populi]|uniref:hypothetical protein n=1 Tax=Luteolibacter sp. Populi TaxID=3230487 RepID=UPI003467A016
MNSRLLTSNLLKACGVLLAGVAAMTVAWELIFPGRIYHCTDDSGFGFLEPGSWVHGPVDYVDRIDTTRPMSEPDVIKTGWTEQGLWAAWWGMAGMAVVAGLTVPWLKREAVKARFGF